MNNRTSLYVVLGLFVLAAIGIASSYINDPSGFIKKIAVFLVIGIIVYFLFKRFFSSGPANKEQRAFVKAAKQSKKRLQNKDSRETRLNFQRRSTSVINSAKKNQKSKKKHSPHLTVIEGKKGKKKNRASF